LEVKGRPVLMRVDFNVPGKELPGVAALTDR
jgi:3-phosphoglycerate kinase